MRRHALSLTVALVSTAFVAPAMAAVPFFNASCPGGVDVPCDEGGPVYVQGREAALKRFNDRYVEARDANSGITWSISSSEDGTPQISYTGRGGANGICQVSASGTPAREEHRDRRRHDDDSDAALPREVTCESTDQQQVAYSAPAGDTALGSCNLRKGAQGTLVTRMPVGSDYQELIIDYPDGRFLCMMRNNGQVQSLTPVRRRG